MEETLALKAELKDYLRKFEETFKQAHNHLPGKEDIPIHVQAKYREYAKLKANSSSLKREGSATTTTTESSSSRAKQQQLLPRSSSQVARPFLTDSEETLHLPTRAEIDLMQREKKQKSDNMSFLAMDVLLSRNNNEPSSFSSANFQTARKNPTSSEPRSIATTTTTIKKPDSDWLQPPPPQECNQPAVKQKLSSMLFTLPQEDAAPLKKKPREDLAPRRDPVAAFPKRKNQENFVKMNLRRKAWQPKKRAKGNRPSKRSSEAVEVSKGPPPRADDIIDLVLDKAFLVAGAKLPRCNHDMDCVEKVVRKASTGNKGRKFFACAYGRDGGCGFFMWADDSTRAALAALQPDGNDKRKKAASHLDVGELRALAGVRGKKASLVEAVCAMWAEDERAAEALRQEGADLESVLRVVFKHEAFLFEQEAVLRSIVEDRKSQLVVRATGSGKSLLYQLPAFLLPGLTVVVSPLIALMQDQLAKLPAGLKGAMLSAAQSAVEQASVVRDLDRLDVLYVSPERFVTASFHALLARACRVDLVCVDEAHCLSSWSHNFRPSYLRLARSIATLRERNNAGLVVLALTATATSKVVRDIESELKVTRTNRSSGWGRDNLAVAIEKARPSEEQRVRELVDAVKRGGGDSQIVYCNTKHETELLCERLKASQVDRCASYHAGMGFAERSKVQSDFMRGKTKVIVATVAFGMGLDKSDVRAVIHYRCPRSIEDYVQEIGRAGRDGLPARCVCFYDEDDARKMASLARGDGVERTQVASLVRKLSSAAEGARACFAVDVDEWCEQLDLKPGVLETLLVGLDRRGLVTLFPSGYSHAAVALKTVQDGGVLAKLVKRAGGGCSNQVRERFGGRFSGKVLVPLLELFPEDDAATPAEIVKKLCIARDVGDVVNFELFCPCLFLRFERAFKDEDALVNDLYEGCATLEAAAVDKLDCMNFVMKQGSQDQSSVTEWIGRYFETSTLRDEAGFTRIEFEGLEEETTRTTIRNDVVALVKAVKAFLQRDDCFHLINARTVARIFHGVSSTVFKYQDWSGSPYWGRYKAYDFDALKAFVEKVLSSS